MAGCVVYRLVFVLIPTRDEGIYARVNPAAENKLASEVGICRQKVTVALLAVCRDCGHSGTATVATNRADNHSRLLTSHLSVELYVEYPLPTALHSAYSAFKCCDWKAVFEVLKECLRNC